MKKVLLLDGYNLIYRARYSGMNKGNNSTVFNFFRGIRPLVEKFNPDVAYFVLEGRPTKRLDLNPDYKGQRVYHNDDDFNRQRKDIISILENYFPFIVTRHPDYECDDVINYLANDKHANDKVTIVSSDTDFIQSINSNTELYNPVRKKFLEATEFDYVSWKALVGDKSDNIKGFKGIGDKRAQKLLSNENDLKLFLSEGSNQDVFKNNLFMIRFHDLTEETKDITYFSRTQFNWDSLKELFTEYEFNSIVSKEKTWNNFVNTFKNLERNI